MNERNELEHVDIKWRARSVVKASAWVICVIGASRVFDCELKLGKLDGFLEFHRNFSINAKNMSKFFYDRQKAILGIPNARSKKIMWTIHFYVNILKVAMPFNRNNWSFICLWSVLRLVTSSHPTYLRFNPFFFRSNIKEFAWKSQRICHRRNQSIQWRKWKIPLQTERWLNEIEMNHSPNIQMATFRTMCEKSNTNTRATQSI